MKVLLAAALFLVPSFAHADAAAIYDRWVRMTEVEKHQAIKEVASVVYLATDDKHTENVCQALLKTPALRREMMTTMRVVLREFESKDFDIQTVSAAIATVILMVARETDGSDT